MIPHHHGVAVIARLEVPAHGGCPTLFDRCHRLGLAMTQRDLRPIGRAMASKDVGDIDLPCRARRDAHRSIVEFGDRVER
jgi:hypothetical protein